MLLGESERDQNNMPKNVEQIVLLRLLINERMEKTNEHEVKTMSSVAEVYCYEQLRRCLQTQLLQTALRVHELRWRWWCRQLLKSALLVLIN